MRGDIFHFRTDGSIQNGPQCSALRRDEILFGVVHDVGGKCFYAVVREVSAAKRMGSPMSVNAVLLALFCLSQLLLCGDVGLFATYRIYDAHVQIGRKFPIFRWIEFGNGSFPKFDADVLDDVL